MGIRIKQLHNNIEITEFQKKCGMGLDSLQQIAIDKKISLQFNFTKSMNRWSIYMWGQKFIGVGENGFIDACRAAAEFTLKILDNDTKSN